MFQQQIHVYMIMYRASWLWDHDTLNIVWGSDGITTVSVFWWGKQKSCVSVYAKMPGVNIIHQQDIGSRHNLDSCWFQVERRPVHPSVPQSINVCQSVHLSGLFLSLALSLSAPRPVYIHEAYLYITPLPFYWMLFQLWTVLGVPDDGHFSFSWENRLTKTHKLQAGRGLLSVCVCVCFHLSFHIHYQ